MGGCYIGEKVDKWIYGLVYEWIVKSVDGYISRKIDVLVGRDR